MAAASTTKTSWRLQEFVAHSSNVSCVALGKTSGRLLATGGEDCKVNIWAVSKPNCIMSLTGHNNPVECLHFSSSEEQVVAGSQSGSLRIWDLEAAKILRTLMGHKANITSLGFHPYGEFLASGSMDTNIKFWDVRRKGCVYRYKGHTQAVRCLAFSPDGKWLASASDDSTIKLWDLTVGKMITEFTAHTAAVNIVQFHPTEYLLASGSSDRTIKLWDLEKFKLIGSPEGEATAVRCVLFSPDGGCLYSGATESLRVYGWEPDRCFDVVPVAWGKVADMAVCNQQLIGVSCQQTNVSSYVVDLTRVKKTGGSEIQGVIRDDQPLTEPSPKGSMLWRNYERPMTTCSSQRVKQSSEAHRRSPEGERRSPSSEDEKDERESTAEIRNAEDYKEIFQPKNAISRTPPKMCEPFPAPLEDGLSGGFVLQSAPNNRSSALGDEEALSQIKKGHDTMCVMLSSRHKNLETVRAGWGSGDVKNSLDTAVSMNDLSIVVDILNIVNLKPSLWKLDLCTSILPQIEELLQSKYESYVQTGCTSLKLILKRFLPLISDTLTAPPSVGVDITREERHQKCKTCYKQLKNLSNVVKNKADQVGRHGSAFKELQLLMAPLDY
uniref:Katanin p80 WD40 repeat-containing subunit B1 n=1 Tax=Myripristis murdjan TaxID=586833 RepID=A0A667XBH5_9TELE